jgi:hypothetical protein
VFSAPVCLYHRPPLQGYEYTKVVESRLRAADPDNDGTLDEKELASRAGGWLLRLLQ